MAYKKRIGDEACCREFTHVECREPLQSQSLPEAILEVGDKLVVLVHFQAWPKGGGQMKEGHIADVYTVHDGKIVQMQAYRDPQEARKAVGLSPHH